MPPAPLPRVRRLCQALPEADEAVAWGEPSRCFFPPYAAASGWIGVWLDRRPRWQAVAELILDGYRLTAPRCPLAALEGR